MNRPNYPPPPSPYGGVPHGGPPQGAPRGPYGQPGRNGPGTPPPPESKTPQKPKRRTSKRVRGAIVAVIVVVGFGIYQQLDGPSGSSPGDCIKVNDVADAEIERVDCGSADALYKVALTFSSAGARCPNGDYAAYTESGRGSSNLLLCMTLNAKAGDCFKTQQEIEVRADCAKDAEYQVLEVIENSDDPRKCGAKNAKNALTYPDPKLTICVAPPPAGTK